MKEILLGILGFILVVVVPITSIVISLWSNRIAKHSNSTAEEALKHAKEAFALTHRPRVIIKSSEDQKGPFLNIHTGDKKLLPADHRAGSTPSVAFSHVIENRGNASAKNLVWDKATAVFDFGGKKTHIPMKLPGGITLDPGGSHRIGPIMRLGEDIGPAQEVAKALESGAATVTLHFSFNYTGEADDTRSFRTEIIHRVDKFNVLVEKQLIE